MAKTAASNLPEVNFSEEGPVRHLHLGSEWIQGSMLLDAQHVLVHEYIQRMMAGLLFLDPETLGQRQALQLGLGAASLTKFCHKVLRMKNTTAIELNPQVLHACKGWFALPADNPRMQVVLADAAEEIKKPRWQAAVDLLHVDLYDEEAAAPVLDSADFYADCRNTLQDQGCMTVNLFGRSSSFQSSVDKIAAAFGMDAVWAFKATREGNTVVMAQRTASRPARKLLTERAQTIAREWGLPAEQWVRVFKPVAP
jgi:spermidine synthase